MIAETSGGSVQATVPAPDIAIERCQCRERFQRAKPDAKMSNRFEVDIHEHARDEEGRRKHDQQLAVPSIKRKHVHPSFGCVAGLEGMTDPVPKALAHELP